MSHIHIPDGILPVWLWVFGLLIVGIYLIFVSVYLKKNRMNKKIILVGMCSAFMMVAMSIEIVPISYHVNLSALTGIILGPVLSPLAVLITSIFLALMGHGGITVVGLNTIAVSLEAVFASLMFNFIKNKLNKPVFVSVFVATFIALVISAFVSIAITYIGTGNPIFNEENPAAHVSFDIRKFASVALLFGLIGWTIESSLTGFIVKYISKVKPDILEN